ncbi:MAG: tryptophan--tRNA ligase [Clostridia bacterium]|nr:tryptophan--tRNA ligase [Clostridia bacterium]
MEKKLMLTGLQPTGTITLGNYIGAIKQMVEYQEKYKSIIFIADMHAITVPIDSETLANNIRQLVAIYIACGIDPEKNLIFLQSDNEFHANISWMLECNTYFGELSRMTQFKDKSAKNQNFTAGLFTYPALMAADILAYDTHYVPVGIDQKQHVEIARDIAIRFNKKYGDTFVVPEPLIREAGTKIMDLQDPTKKMSKSSESQKGVIRILDDVNTIRKKINSAVTDSVGKVNYDPENQPGIANLINIYTSLTGVSKEEVVEQFADANYGTFKKAVGDVVAEKFEKIQARYNELINSDELDKILDEGMKKSREIAKAKYEMMKNKIGLRR